MGVTAAIAAVVGTGYSVYAGERADNMAEKAARDARDRAKSTADAADKAFNAANMKRPDLNALMTANRDAAKAGGSGTMLTGPAGIDPNQMLLGKNTLLGA